MRYTFYHGTDAKALKMSKEQRDIFRNVCNTVADYYWDYFTEYRKKRNILSLRKKLTDPKLPYLFENFQNALKITDKLKSGDKSYELGALYVTNKDYLAVSYSSRAFAFGETGLRAYRFVVAAKKLGIYDNLDGTIKQYADFVYRFGEMKEEPVVCTLLDITPSMLLTETGKEVTEDNIMQHQSFRLKKGYELSPSTAMPTWLFARMCDKTKWPPCYR